MGKTKKTNIENLAINDASQTPVMRQHQELKQKYPDAILFFRMGDFYELFFEDAKVAAPIMGVALTRRQNEIPMAGVPYHSVENYLHRLLEAGHHVAIAEQEPDPRNPRLMCRRVRRVITPGTVLEEKLLDSLEHSYLMAMVFSAEFCGLAFVDVSTGDFFSFEVKRISQQEDELVQIFRDYYIKFSPREVLIPSDLYGQLHKIPEYKVFVAMEAWKGSPTEGRRQIEANYGQSLDGLGYTSGWSPALGAVSLILHYVQKTFPDESLCLSAPIFRSLEGRYMQLDEQTIRNLDIVQNQRESGHSRSLYGVLDMCKTSIGKRFLRESLLLPLIDRAEIQQRQQIVAYLYENKSLCDQMSQHLKMVFDIERMLARLGAKRGSPRDFLAIISTLEAASALADLCADHSDSIEMQNVIAMPEELGYLREHLEAQVDPEAPATLPGNSYFLKSGVDLRLDQAREAVKEGGKWILKFEQEERQRTGISSLRVKYNKIHGYFIEISRGQAAQVPSDYYRKQTLTTSERFSNKALSDLEVTLAQSEEIIQKIEQERFHLLCQAVIEKYSLLKELMVELARLDFFLCLACIALKKHWTRPHISEEGTPPIIEIKDGCHPVVEHYLAVGEHFTTNGLTMDRYDASFAILTGPNMAGKSTYIRQVALIQLLAQIGSFVPAKVARLSIKDRIFTRIGAGDNLSRGESTFFTEMLEVARILNQSTGNSLVIMDEVGRGTSTYDGLSLAWSIVEYLSDGEGPRPLSLFATHYHELTELAERSNVFNLTMEVHEDKGKVIFLHRVCSGVANRSYGIHVASLAGIPQELIQRAEKKLEELESTSSMRQKLTSEPMFFSASKGKKFDRRDSKSSTTKDQPLLF